MIKTFFILVLLFIAVVFGQNSNNATSAPQATADNTKTLFDLYSCAGNYFIETIVIVKALIKQLNATRKPRMVVLWKMLYVTARM
jgi:hypothetical protein